MLTACALGTDGVDFDFCIRNRDMRSDLQHEAQSVSRGIVSQTHRHGQARPCYQHSVTVKSMNE